MANFWESIDALKEFGLADSEILEIMFESTDGQMYAKNLLKNKESSHEFPEKISDTHAESPSVRKRNVIALGAEENPKSIRQGSPRQSLDREKVRHDYSLNRAVYPLSVSSNRFSFSPDIDEASDNNKSYNNIHN